MDKREQSQFTKACSSCKKEKSLNDFYSKPNGIHGVDSKCKSCVSQYKKQLNQKLKSKRNKEIYISTDLCETMDVSKDFYCQLIGVGEKNASI